METLTLSTITSVSSQTVATSTTVVPSTITRTETFYMAGNRKREAADPTGGGTGGQVPDYATDACKSWEKYLLGCKCLGAEPSTIIHHSPVYSAVVTSTTTLTSAAATVGGATVVIITTPVTAVLTSTSVTTTTTTKTEIDYFPEPPLEESTTTPPVVEATGDLDFGPIDPDPTTENVDAADDAAPTA